MTDMKTLWEEIAAWFKEHARPCYDDMMRVPGGADEDQLAALEEDLSCTIPEDFKDFLRLYNKSYRVAFFEYLAFDIRLIRKQRDGLNRQLDTGVFDNAQLFPDVDQVRRAKWHSGWLPFAEDGGGNLICLDLAPPENGRYGQVFHWEIRGGPANPKAASFQEFVTAYRDALLSGRYTYDETSGIFQD